MLYSKNITPAAIGSWTRRRAAARRHRRRLAGRHAAVSADAVSAFRRHGGGRCARRAGLRALVEAHRERQHPRAEVELPAQSDRADDAGGGVAPAAAVAAGQDRVRPLHDADRRSAPIVIRRSTTAARRCPGWISPAAWSSSRPAIACARPTSRRMPTPASAPGPNSSSSTSSRRSRTRRRPRSATAERRQNTVMPMTAYAGMTREDLAAIYAFLRSQKPVVNRVNQVPGRARRTQVRATYVRVPDRHLQHHADAVQSRTARSTSRASAS